MTTNGLARKADYNLWIMPKSGKYKLFIDKELGASLVMIEFLNESLQVFCPRSIRISKNKNKCPHFANGVRVKVSDTIDVATTARAIRFKFYKLDEGE